MKRNEILEAAIKCVCTDRNQMYSEPEDNFRLIGEFWTHYLKARCVSAGAEVTVDTADVAMMMVLFKVAREATSIEPKADTFVDIAGYAACGGEIATACRGGTPAEETVEESKHTETYLQKYLSGCPGATAGYVYEQGCPADKWNVDCGMGKDGVCSPLLCWNQLYKGEAARR